MKGRYFPLLPGRWQAFYLFQKVLDIFYNWMGFLFLVFVFFMIYPLGKAHMSVRFQDRKSCLSTLKEHPWTEAFLRLRSLR